MLKKPNLEKLGSVFYILFSVQRLEGKPVTGPMVIEKANNFITRWTCYIKNAYILIIGLKNFKRGIHRLDVTGKIRSSDEICNYRKTFNSIVSNHNLTTSQIYNSDEASNTALFALFSLRKSRQKLC